MEKGYMKVFLLAICVVAFSVSAVFAATQIDWQTDFDKALAQAKQEKKWVFASFYSNRCPLCDQMDRNVFAKPEAAGVVSRFVPVRVNTDAKPELAMRYQVDGVPANLVLDAEGKILEILLGPVPLDSFVEQVTPIAAGKNPLDLLAEKAAASPESASTQLMVGRQFLQRQHYSRGRPYLEKGYQLAEEDTNLREIGARLIVASFLFEEELDGATSSITRYQGEFPNSPYLGAMYFDLGRMNFEREAYEVAAANFTQAKELADDFMLKVRANWMLSEAKEKLAEKP